MVPEPEPGYAVVFRDYFTYGLCFPPYPFLCQVMEAFHLESDPQQVLLGLRVIRVSAQY